jgi:hypothetical protein
MGHLSPAALQYGNGMRSISQVAAATHRLIKSFQRIAREVPPPSPASTGINELELDPILISVSFVSPETNPKASGAHTLTPATHQERASTR